MQLVPKHRWSRSIWNGELWCFLPAEKEYWTKTGPIAMNCIIWGHWRCGLEFILLVHLQHAAGWITWCPETAQCLTGIWADKCCEGFKVINTDRENYVENDTLKTLLSWIKANVQSVESKITSTYALEKEIQLHFHSGKYHGVWILVIPPGSKSMLTLVDARETEKELIPWMAGPCQQNKSGYWIVTLEIWMIEG